YPECVDLRLRPFPLVPGLIETDEPPPLLAEEDRQHHERADALRLEQRALALREGVDVAQDRAAGTQDLPPAFHARRRVRCLPELRVLDLRRDARCGPLVALGRGKLPAPDPV